MAEPITIHGTGGGFDDDGYPLPGGADRQVVAKSVQPIELDELSDDDRQGVVEALRVWCSTTVTPGETVTVRGRVFRVVKPAWDWGAHRRPAVARHRPSQVFECVRGAG